MHEDKIAQYRAEAALCISRANADSNKSTSARWLKVAGDWTRMANELQAKIHSPGPESPRKGRN